SGDILLQKETDIGPSETFGELHDRLASEGARLLVETIEQVIAQTVSRKPQDAALATFAPRITKETATINWKNKASDIVNLIRGLSPAPAAYTFWEGRNLKIFQAVARTGKVNQAPGTIGAAEEAGLPVAATDGYVILRDVQLAGKKRMPIADFLRGHPMEPGSVLT
ncbi:MAG TPA: methionyl-tRNA formyltransferase, partial [Smithella sp.]|nr:methionyl-tRNA formyltransferase [Smithella sp.]